MGANLKKSFIIMKVIPFILMFFSFSFSMVFIKHNYYKLMNSDTSAEVLLGRLLNLEGGIFSKGWFYSTEIRVIDVQILFKFFYGLFSDNWLLIRMFTSGVMLILLVASYLIMMHALDLYNIGLYTAWILFLPFSQVYGYMIIYGVYYDRILILTFLTVGLTLKISTSNVKPNNGILILFVFLNILSGFYGIRQAMVFYAPLILTVLFEIYEKLKQKDSISLKDLPEETIRFIKTSVSATIFYGIGYIINIIVISKILQYHGQSFTWEKFSLTRVLDSITLFVDAYGQYEFVSALRPFGIASMLGIFSIGLMTISVISLFKNRNKLPGKLRLFTLFAIFDFAFTCFFGSFSFSMAPITYWIPVIPLFVPFWGLILKYNEYRLNQLIGKIAIFFVVAHIVLSALCTYLHPNDQRIPYCKDYSVYVEAAKFLKESDYTQGFATTWLSDLMTEMTAGKMEMWVVNNTETFTDNPQESIYEWLQVKDHKKALPQGEFIVLTYNPEYAVANDMIGIEDFKYLAEQDENLVYSDDYARIYAFKNLEELTSLYQKLEER